MKRIHTIGHSNIGVDDFLHLLLLHNINCIIDVRSVPASAYTPQFNKEPLKIFLKKHNITYVHFGEEFGARRTDCLIDGQVNFEQAAQTEKFLLGYSRINNAIDLNYNLSLMCSEANPLECHRFSLVSRYLHEHDFDVCHILKDGNIKTHQELENEMINTYLNSRLNKLREIETNLFGEMYTAEQQRVDAYRIKNKEIGYCINEYEYENQF